MSNKNFSTRGGLALTRIPIEVGDWKQVGFQIPAVFVAARIFQMIDAKRQTVDFYYEKGLSGNSDGPLMTISYSSEPSAGDGAIVFHQAKITRSFVKGIEAVRLFQPIVDGTKIHRGDFRRDHIDFFENPEKIFNFVYSEERFPLIALTFFEDLLQTNQGD